jgi:hypothetical protein
MEIFKKGDRVIVQSACSSYGQKGTVTKHIYSNINPDYHYVQVKLDYGDIRSYNEQSLSYINTSNQNNITTKGEDNMLMGNYKVAMVKFLQGVNTTKEYAFALFNEHIQFDEYIQVDDLVLCDTQNGYSVAKVTDIMNQSEYNGVDVTKEIICKVDFTDFETRKENREKAKKLKAEMDRKVKELQGIALIELMAEKNPELKDMLDAYKNLVQ